MTLRAFFDGLCEPVNPGRVACFGFVVYRRSPSGDVKVFEDDGVAAEPAPNSTHDMAEYTGLIKALEWVQANLEDREIELFGDSKLVIGQIKGEHEVTAPEIPFYRKTRSLLEGVSWTATWIHREENSVADELTLKAYGEYCMKRYGKIPPTMRQRGAIR